MNKKCNGEFYTKDGKEIIICSRRINCKNHTNNEKHKVNCNNTEKQFLDFDKNKDWKITT